MRAHSTDDRGVSTQISHVFGIAITSLLIVVLLNGVAGYVQDERANVADSQLETIGNQLASQVERADELGQHGGSVSVETTVDSTVVGNSYRVSLAEGDPCDTGTFHTDSCLVLEADSVDAAAKVPVNLTSDVKLENEGGGTFVMTVVSAGGAADSARPVADHHPRIGVGRSFTVNRFATVVSPVNRPPVAKFTFSPGMPRSGDEIRFSADDSFDVDGDVVAYKWDFDDDGSFEALGRNVSRQLDPGPREVMLRVVDNEGATSNVTRELRVSGLAYNGDLENTEDGADGSDEGAITFTVTNEYASSIDSSIEVTEVLVDPKDDSLSMDDDLNLLVDEEDDGSFDSTTTIGGSLPSGGRIIDVSDSDAVYLSESENARFWIGTFDGDSDLSGTAFDIGVRYRVDGQMNSTVFTDVAGSPNVEDVRIETSGDDVNLVVYADEELDTIEFDLGGDLSGTASDIDSTTDEGDRYRHELNLVGTLSSGTVKANLTVAEAGGVSAYETRGSKSINETLTLLDGDYVWRDASDWDGAAAANGVVHDSFGDHQNDRVALGYPPEDQFDDDLVGYWPLDGNADDASGSGLSGTMRNGPSDAFGAYGTSSLQFDGGNDYIDVGSGLGDVHSDTSSLSAWVQTSSDGHYNMWEAPGILGVEQDGGGDDIFWGWIDDAGHIGIQAGDAAAAKSDSPIDDGQWHHVAMTYDASTGEASMYVDGEHAETVTTRSGPIGTNFGSIGRIEDTAGTPEHFDGKIEEVRSYDRVLSGSEVEALANSSGRLMTDWKSGSPALDSSNMRLQYGADIPSATSINVTVLADTDGDGDPDAESDQIELRDGQDQVSVSGIPDAATRFKLKIEFDSDSVVKTPVLHKVGITEDT